MTHHSWRATTPGAAPRVGENGTVPAQMSQGQPSTNARNRMTLTPARAVSLMVALRYLGKGRGDNRGDDRTDVGLDAHKRARGATLATPAVL